MTTSEQWRKIGELFDALVELDAGERNRPPCSPRMTIPIHCWMAMPPTLFRTLPETM